METKKGNALPSEVIIAKEVMPDKGEAAKEYTKYGWKGRSSHKMWITAADSGKSAGKRNFL